MKINTKRFALPAIMLALLFATTACGGSHQPMGGIDVSALSPALLSISPVVATPDLEQDENLDRQPSAPQTGSSPDASGTNHKQLTINN